MFVRRPYLGDLEIAVMEQLWSAGPADAKAVHRALGVSRGISANTVQSTMERLFKKELLRREKISHAYVYSSAANREELMAQMIDNVVDKLAGGDSEAMLAAFVDLAERVNEDSLARLEELIAVRRQKR
ncbi:MAG: BlaI/MecI/CopY family transcriptional regulator [Trichloromonadaceae bacterium]